MAHECYHYLHHQSLNRLMCMTDVADTSRHKREANRFAACLLMPEGTVRSALGRYRLSEAGGRMMVSPEALQWRLKELGISEGTTA